MRAMKSGAGSFAICKEYVAAHPQARNIGQVYSVINDLESKRISLDFPEQSLSGRAIKVSVSGTNIYAPYILAVPCAVTDNSQGVKYSRLRSVGAAAASLRVNLAGQAPDECEAEVDFPAPHSRMLCVGGLLIEISTRYLRCQG